VAFQINGKFINAEKVKIKLRDIFVSENDTKFEKLKVI